MLDRRLGNYQLESVIGEGGMGVVYLARHAVLGRPAAVKILHPELSTNESIVSRFFNEARAASAVRDPGIVEVFDFGIEDRTAYLVMEYLEGESLAARMQRGRSPIDATLRVVCAIARALHAAHEQGIVHRDLKPDNVFIVRDPELPAGERVKLLDFGIAKLAGTGDANTTRTGTVMGTPTYMAPEQCRGSGRIDHRADLYALGCVAYEMLCGRPPFLADGAGDVIARHLYFPPLPLRSHHPELPAEIDALVLWLLEKDPAARPETAADLIRAADHLAAMLVPLAGRGEPPTIQSMIRNATAPTRLPLPMGITTLGGAASAVTVIGTPRPPRRLPGLIAAAAAGLGLAALIAVAHGRGDPAAASVSAAGAPPAGATVAAGSPAAIAATVPPGGSPGPYAAAMTPGAGAPGPYAAMAPGAGAPGPYAAAAGSPAPAALTAMAPGAGAPGPYAAAAGSPAPAALTAMGPGAGAPAPYAAAAVPPAGSPAPYAAAAVAPAGSPAPYAAAAVAPAGSPAPYAAAAVPPAGSPGPYAAAVVPPAGSPGRYAAAMPASGAPAPYAAMVAPAGSAAPAATASVMSSADASDIPPGQHAVLAATLSADPSHGGIHRVVLSITNRGPDPAYRVVARLRSSSPAIHGLLLSFGRIERGETRTRTQDLVPAGDAEDLSPIVVAAVTSADAPSITTTSKLRLAAEAADPGDRCKQGRLTREAYRIKRNALQAALAAGALGQADVDAYDAALVRCLD